MADLGGELARYRLRLVPMLALIPAIGVGALCLAAFAPVFALFALVPLGFLTWLLVAHGGDRLVVHRDGFALHHRGTVRACRWDHIARVESWNDGDRGQISSVTTLDGETIVFPQFMGGLVELHKAYVTVIVVAPRRNPEGIGALVSTHRPARLWRSLPSYFVAGVIQLIGLALAFSTLDVPDQRAGDIWFGIGCAAAGCVPLALVLWVTLSDRDDELRIHEHGFAYQRRDTVQDCRWDEIADSRRASRYSVCAILRDDGTWINMPADINEIRDCVDPRRRAKWTT